MRHVMMLFLCDAIGCEARTESLVAIRFDSYTAEGIALANGERWRLPEGWGTKGSDSSVLPKQRDVFDSNTFCPKCTGSQ